MFEWEKSAIPVSDPNSANKRPQPHHQTLNPTKTTRISHLDPTTTTTTAMPDSALPLFKQNFLQTCINASILKFGSFTLKSGRQSPYFFQAGNFNTCGLLTALATAYAETILSNSIEFDVIFGPAYKGIPLVSTTALELYKLAPEKCRDIGYAFNRKEAKDHGEKGSLVGMELKGKRVLVVDDVMTAGTAMREAVEIIQAEGGTVVGAVVALDREERVSDQSEESTVQAVRRELGIEVWSILCLTELITGVKDQESVEKMKEYREKYAAKSG